MTAPKKAKAKAAPSAALAPPPSPNALVVYVPVEPVTFPGGEGSNTNAQEIVHVSDKLERMVEKVHVLELEIRELKTEKRVTTELTVDRRAENADRRGGWLPWIGVAGAVLTVVKIIIDLLAG